jgi:probable phosphoglycerate mutase
MTTRGYSSEMTGQSLDSAVLYLVRHGESGWNLADRVQGQSSSAESLTATGRAQAAHTGELLAERVPKAESIVASDLPRARETAEIIAARLHLPIRFDPQLREQRLGEFEGHPFSGPWDNGTVTQAVDALWREPFRSPPGGESIAQLYRRVHAALHRHATENPGKEIVVVTHGGPVRMATSAAAPTPGRPMSRPDVPNASISPWRIPCPAL